MPPSDLNGAQPTAGAGEAWLLLIAGHGMELQFRELKCNGLMNAPILPVTGPKGFAESQHLGIKVLVAYADLHICTLLVAGLPTLCLTRLQRSL